MIDDIPGDDPILMIDDSSDPVDENGTAFDDSVEGTDYEGTGVISVDGSENEAWKDVD